MRTMLVTLSLLSAVPLLAQGRAADEAALRGVVTAFEAAVNKRDMAAVAALYTTDADAVVGDAPVANGRTAIQAGLHRDWGSSPASRRIHLTVVDIRFLGPDVALVNTRAQFTEGAVK